MTRFLLASQLKPGMTVIAHSEALPSGHFKIAHVDIFDAMELGGGQYTPAVVLLRSDDDFMSVEPNEKFTVVS